jgi:hypothetical protein
VGPCDAHSQVWLPRINAKIIFASGANIDIGEGVSVYRISSTPGAALARPLFGVHARLCTDHYWQSG